MFGENTIKDKKTDSVGITKHWGEFVQPVLQWNNNIT